MNIKGILDEFKAFIMRGNVIQVAVAFAIGAAFKNVTDAANTFIIQPILGIFGGVQSLSWMNAKYLMIGSFLDVVIGFIITAAAIFFIIVKPMNKLMGLIAPKEDNAPPPVPEDIQLLREIRDELKKQSSQP